MFFQPGQYIIVSIPNSSQRREYSIYSSPEDDVLEIFVAVVENGHISPELSCLVKGDTVHTDGPFGYFLIDESDLSSPFLFIATGSRISPFHNFIRFYPNLDYLLMHGIRRLDDACNYSDYEMSRLVSCVSQEEGGHYYGWATGWLEENHAPENGLVYLCGSSGIMNEAYRILESQGIGSSRIHAELYS